MTNVLPLLKSPWLLGIAGAALIYAAGYTAGGNAEHRRGETAAMRIRTEIETRWMRDADRIAQQNKERADALAAIDDADAGADVCLPADSVQRLRAVR